MSQCSANASENTSTHFSRILWLFPLFGDRYISHFPPIFEAYCTQPSSPSSQTSLWAHRIPLLPNPSSELKSFPQQSQALCTPGIDGSSSPFPYTKQAALLMAPYHPAPKAICTWPKNPHRKQLIWPSRAAIVHVFNSSMHVNQHDGRGGADVCWYRLKSRTQMYAHRGVLHSHWTQGTQDLWQVCIFVRAYLYPESALLLLFKFLLVLALAEEVLGHRGADLTAWKDVYGNRFLKTPLTGTFMHAYTMVFRESTSNTSTSS